MDAKGPTWVNLSVAARSRGCVRQAILRAAVGGQIRTQAAPGCPQMFCLEDARKIVLPRKGTPRPVEPTATS
jgi:hypothetical protein